MANVRHDVVAVLILLSGCNEQAATARKQQLELVAFGISKYRDFYGTLPPIFVTDADGHLLHTWRVLILPFVEGNGFTDQYDLTSPWNSHVNEDLRDGTRRNPDSKFPEPSTVGKVYLRPGAGNSSDTIFVALVHVPLEEKSFTGNQKGFYLPVDKPFLIIEMENSGIHWMEPRDIALNPDLASRELSFEEIKERIVRSAEIGKETKIRDRKETLQFVEDKLGKG